MAESNFQLYKRIADDRAFGKALLADDVVDALAAAVAARIGGFQRLPQQPDVDLEGLPMEMVFAKPDSLRSDD